MMNDHSLLVPRSPDPDTLETMNSNPYQQKERHEMNKPNISARHDYYSYWMPVVSGQAAPDEWQQALMDLTQKALDSGLFYNRDVDAYFRKNADFIPAEWWDLQYLPPHAEVEGGIMGMELYMARDTLRENKRRAENAKCEALYPVGTKLGTLNVNGKKYTGMTVTEYKNGQVYLEGKAGSYKVVVWCEPGSLETMKERAIARGWRKS